MQIQVIKRNGSVEEFDPSRITRAIELAVTAINGHQCDVENVTDIVTREIYLICGHDDSKIGIEKIQDMVEQALMQQGCYEVAKEYIVYRSKRAEEREEYREKLQKKFEKSNLFVTKKDGSKELFEIEKIHKLFDRASQWYEKTCSFEDLKQAFKKNIVADISTKDISRLLIKTCIDLVTIENIDWEHIAARIKLFDLYKELGRKYSPEGYRDLVRSLTKSGKYNTRFAEYTDEDLMDAASVLDKSIDLGYRYTTIHSLTKRYLIKKKELPQEMYLSVALFLALAEKPEDRLSFAKALYRACATGEISLPTPTLLNARTNFAQLSSCFKINIDDDLRGIYHGIENMAQISKFGGGIGSYLGHIRSKGSHIRGVVGASGGVTPWTKVINDTGIAVNQLGARLGAISVTLDVWHLDIYDFLDLQTETGDIRSKAFDVFPAIAVPDIFMRRVEANESWTLFDPHEVKMIYGISLEDHFGAEFDAFYEKLEKDDRITLKKEISAKDLFKKFLKTAVETGMPYVFYRDTVNKHNANRHAGNIYSTQLCTEICQNSSPSKFIDETLEWDELSIKYQPGDLVTCNLASINIAKVHDRETIARVIPLVMRALDNVISLNLYPIKEAERTAHRYRPVALGYLGFAEYLATNGYAYDSEKARQHADDLFEVFALEVFKSSIAIAGERGAYPLYEWSEYSKGKILSHDRAHYMANSAYSAEWSEVFDALEKNGIRFGYLFGPAPNTSTAGLVGTTAALLPIYKKYFVETNLTTSIRVAPKLSAENFWLYKEYTNMDMNDVIDMISVIYKWIDQSISFEWMIDPARVSPAELYSYYFKAWRQGVKTVYYVRSLSAEVEGCVSCSG